LIYIIVYLQIYNITFSFDILFHLLSESKAAYIPSIQRFYPQLTETVVLDSPFYEAPFFSRSLPRHTAKRIG